MLKMSSNLSLCVKLNLSNILGRTKSVRSFSGLSLLPTPWNSNNILQSRRLLHTSFENAAFLNKVKLMCPSFLCFRSNSKSIYSHNMSKYFNKSGSVSLSSAASTEPLTKIQAQDLILRLTDEERRALLSALQEFQSEKMKAEYEGQLAGTRWRSKFGRPSKLPHLGDVDPTGSYCPVPEDWLMRKYAQHVITKHAHKDKDK